MKLVRALIIASHPIPSLAVTAMATLLTAEAAPAGVRGRAGGAGGAGGARGAALRRLVERRHRRGAGRGAGGQARRRRPGQRARPLAGGGGRGGGLARAGGRARPGQPGDRRGDDRGRVVVQPRAEVDRLVRCAATRSRSGCCRRSRRRRCPGIRWRAGRSRRRRRCSGWARTSPTCCPTWRPTRATGCAGCRSGWPPGPARPPPGRPPSCCCWPPRCCCWSRPARDGGGRRSWGWCCSGVLAVAGAAGTRAGAVPGRDRHRRGQRRAVRRGRRGADRRARISRARWADDADRRGALGLPCPPLSASRPDPGGRVAGGDGRRRRADRPAVGRTAARPQQRALLERLHGNAGVDTRHTVLPAGGLRRARRRPPTTGTSRRRRRSASGRCAAPSRPAGLAAGDLDLLIVTSVTGVAVPSLDALLMPRLGLRADVKRLPVFGLGCVAGAAGLARLHDYLLGWPRHAAALLAVELCSLSLPRLLGDHRRPGGQRAVRRRRGGAGGDRDAGARAGADAARGPSGGGDRPAAARAAAGDRDPERGLPRQRRTRSAGGWAPTASASC